MIEKDFDVPFVAAMAFREKQIQQNYRPVIAVHKWFARRPGTLFRSLALIRVWAWRLRDIYFKANSLKGMRVADPFMGGGTPLLEANRLGCDIIGYDINPMAYWIVRQEIAYLDLFAYRKAAYQTDRLARKQTRLALQDTVSALPCSRCRRQIFSLGQNPDLSSVRQRH